MKNKILKPNESDFKRFASKSSVVRLALDVHDTMHIIGVINNKNPDAITFTLDDKTVKSLTLSLMMFRFDNVLLLYGYSFTKELLFYFEKEENYEACAAILADTQFVNENLKTNFDLSRK